jgi:hypothetical protein
MAGFLRRLVLLAVALAVATVLLVGAMARLTPNAEASAALQPDQAGKVERDVARAADEPASNGSSPLPAVALVLGGLVLMAAMPTAQRVHVYYHRPPGSYWQ